jgi:hypothetical protein
MYAGIGCVSLFYVIDTGSIGSRIPPPRDRLVSEILGILAPTIFSLLQY